MSIKCLIKKNDEEGPEPIIYTNVRTAYDRIKERAHNEHLEVSDYTIIPIEDAV